jgi:hypothetical protein
LILVLEMSESSRLRSVIEIGDLSDDDAVRFLVERQLEPDVAKQIVEVTGGRLRLLKMARIDLFDKQPLEGTFFSSFIS